MVSLLTKEQSDLGPYCLQYRLPKYISRRDGSGQKLRLVGKWLIEDRQDSHTPFWEWARGPCNWEN